MNDSQKTKKQLLEELARLRHELVSMATPRYRPREVTLQSKEPDGTYYQVFLTSPDISFIADPNNGTYLEVNDSFVKNTGYTRKELIGHRVIEANLWANQEEFFKMNRLLAV